MKSLDVVKVMHGFWKGHEATLVDKIFMLPLYKAVVGYRVPSHLPSLDYLYASLPNTHWFFRWQFRVTTHSDDWQSKVDITDECIKYLVKHCSTVINMSDKRVSEAMGRNMPDHLMLRAEIEQQEKK